MTEDVIYVLAGIGFYQTIEISVLVIRFVLKKLANSRSRENGGLTDDTGRA